MKYMVTPTGLEPVTSRLGILRSILMSYGASQRRRSDCDTIMNAVYQPIS